MKRNLLFATLTLVSLSGALVLAQQAPVTNGGAMMSQPGATGGDMKGMMDNKMSPEMKTMMEKMSPGMKMRCQMLMNTEVIPNDAAAVLSLKVQLKLTDAQVASLAAINKEAQDKAIAVLTGDQKKTLDVLPKTPQTMMDMHEQMMGQMKTMMGDKMGEQMMNCPMMEMMGPSATQPEHAMKDMPAAPKP